MGKIHVVKPGDCMASVAYEHGFFPETCWEHPQNAALRENRKNPSLLEPGDEVFIPDRREKEVQAATGQRHRFRRRGVPERLRIRFEDDQRQPRAGVVYRLEVGGVTRVGQSDAAGWIDVYVPPDAVTGRLVLTTAAGEEVFDLLVGHLPPLDDIRGIQVRLWQLGYPRGDDEPGTLGQATRVSLEAFQGEHGLTVTGEVDDATRAKIAAVYGA